jgi:hypothetical protein
MKNWAKKSKKNALELCITHQAWLLIFGVFHARLSVEMKIDLETKNCGSVTILAAWPATLNFSTFLLINHLKSIYGGMWGLITIWNPSTSALW